MIFIISVISFIVLGILAFVLADALYSDGPSIVLSILAFAAFILAWVSLFVGSSIQDGQPQFASSDVKQSLVALGTNETDDGGYWFLGSGQVDNKPIYNYLVIDDDGFITQEWEYTRDSRVNEDGGDAPYVETIHYAKPGNIWVPWDSNEGYTVDFHVPAGSVQGGFYEVELGTDSN